MTRGNAGKFVLVVIEPDQVQRFGPEQRIIVLSTIAACGYRSGRVGIFAISAKCRVSKAFFPNFPFSTSFGCIYLFII